ncbi:MAG: carboxypeptidase regulatory-like domain-containing protein [Pseudomonadota bacterium]
MLPPQRSRRRLSIAIRALSVVISLVSLPVVSLGATSLAGKVVDSNGKPLAQAQVLFDRQEPAQGASVVTVFTDSDGAFAFPGVFAENINETADITVRSLGYKQIDRVLHDNGAAVTINFVVTATDNQIDVAPASAWLARITDREEKSKFIMSCIDCHQVPASEQRSYAASIADMHAADPLKARTDSWNMIVKYMNFLSAWEFGRGRRNDGEKQDTEAVYDVENGTEVADLMARVFDDRLDHISGYSWGAPLIANANTRIWEYEFEHPNAVREAMLLGSPQQLWVADVSANHLFTVDIVTGKRETHEVPTDVLMSPHSMHRGADGSLWVTPLFNSIVGHLDVNTGKWQTWRLRTADGKNPGIHDLSFGWEHELLTDADGRVWFSDIGNNSVGYFNPADGQSEIWPAPPSPGRPGRTSLYGLSMTKDHKQVWYSQLGNGTFGGFDIETKQYIGPFQLPDPNAGPRRISISDDDVLYLALYGSGQLAEFDTKTREMIGIYDLPDTASTPYATTWDPVRKVVWIAASNNDVIYRFDPKDKSFGVLPLPREQTFLRMIDVDPETGVLVTSYGNIVDIVQGPRMALVIDPGDNAYPKPFMLDGSGQRQ